MYPPISEVSDFTSEASEAEQIFALEPTTRKPTVALACGCRRRTARGVRIFQGIAGMPVVRGYRGSRVLLEPGPEAEKTCPSIMC